MRIGALENLRLLIKQQVETSLKKKLPLSIPSNIFLRRLSQEMIQKEIQKDPEKKKLYEAATQIEAYFLEQAFKSMRKTVGKNTLFSKSLAQKIFEDMLWQERALLLSKEEDLGLAEEIYSRYKDFA